MAGPNEAFPADTGSKTGGLPAQATQRSLRLASDPMESRRIDYLATNYMQQPLPPPPPHGAGSVYRPAIDDWLPISRASSTSGPGIHRVRAPRTSRRGYPPYGPSGFSSRRVEQGSSSQAPAGEASGLVSTPRHRPRRRARAWVGRWERVSHGRILSRRLVASRIRTTRLGRAKRPLAQY